MFTRAFKQHRQLVRLLAEWGILFIFLVWAIWAATQHRDAPLLILLTVLFVITLNFSLPPSSAGVSLVPVVSVSTFLVIGLPTAVTLLIVGYFLAELAQPVWQPLWEAIPKERSTWVQRLTNSLIYLLALIVSAVAYQQNGGQAPLIVATLENSLSFAALVLTYGTLYFGATWLWWVLQKQPVTYFFRENALAVFAAGFLAQLFAILGGEIFALGGLPIFVVFCLGLALFSVIIWLSWQRRYFLEQQLTQFALLNQQGDALRETLQLSEVLQRAYQLVSALVAVDTFTIFLEKDDGWQALLFDDRRQAAATPPLMSGELDDFTNWVIQNGRPLALDPGNIHFAARHQLSPPTPAPTIWLGLPITSSERLLGVMVLQRFGESRPFSQWNQELLRSIAAQTSTAIQNAHLYSETVRLYNLTDEALAQRLKQLQALLNAMGEGVLMIDRAGSIVLINPTARALLGPHTPDPAQPLDAQTMAVSLGFDEQQLTNRLKQLQAGDPYLEKAPVLYTLMAAEDGRHRIIERQEAAVLDRHEQLLGWLLLFRDVTKAEELAERREDLTRMIVHDLRNPLTTIATTIQMVHHRLPTADQAGSELTIRLQDAHTSSLDLLDMVDSLMDINRLEAGQSIVEAEAMRLPPLVHKVARRLQPLLTYKQIEFTITEADQLPAVWADAELVRRVLVNLLDNAQKFTPAHGRISVHMQAEPAANGQEPGVRCLIQDSGPGIPPDFREQLFNRFMRTNVGGAQVRGTGLGLTFCKMVLEAQNGRIWVEDVPQGGTQFVFTLPGIPELTIIE